MRPYNSSYNNDGKNNDHVDGAKRQFAQDVRTCSVSRVTGASRDESRGLAHYYSPIINVTNGLEDTNIRDTEESL